MRLTSTRKSFLEKAALRFGYISCLPGFYWFRCSLLVARRMTASLVALRYRGNMNRVSWDGTFLFVRVVCLSHLTRLLLWAHGLQNCMRSLQWNQWRRTISFFHNQWNDSQRDLFSLRTALIYSLCSSHISPARTLAHAFLTASRALMSSMYWLLGWACTIRKSLPSLSWAFAAWVNLVYNLWNLTDSQCDLATWQFHNTPTHTKHAEGVL